MVEIRGFVLAQYCLVIYFRVCIQFLELCLINISHALKQFFRICVFKKNPFTVVLSWSEGPELNVFLSSGKPAAVAARYALLL